MKYFVKLMYMFDKLQEITDITPIIIDLNVLLLKNFSSYLSFIRCMLIRANIQIASIFAL